MQYSLLCFQMSTTKRVVYYQIINPYESGWVVYGPENGYEGKGVALPSTAD